jgi:hypothetical protein
MPGQSAKRVFALDRPGILALWWRRKGLDGRDSKLGHDEKSIVFNRLKKPQNDAGCFSSDPRGAAWRGAGSRQSHLAPASRNF